MMTSSIYNGNDLCRTCSAPVPHYPRLTITSTALAGVYHPECAPARPDTEDREGWAQMKMSYAYSLGDMHKPSDISDLFLLELGKLKSGVPIDQTGVVPVGKQLASQYKFLQTAICGERPTHGESEALINADCTLKPL